MPSDQQTDGSADRISITVRPSQPEDGADLFRLFASARESEYAVLNWSNEQLRDFLHGQFEAQQKDYALRFPAAERRVVILDGQTAGTFWTARLEGELRLLDIIVAPEHRGRGIGTVLMNALKSEALEAGLPLRHMVARSNARAIHLYERLGFKVVADAGSHFLMECLPEGPVSPSSG